MKKTGGEEGQVYFVSNQLPGGEEGHPLKGPCQEKRLPLRKKWFFLQGLSVEWTAPSPLPQFLSIQWCQPSLHQSPIRIQARREKYTAPIGPFRSVRTRKSSVPCRGKKGRKKGDVREEKRGRSCRNCLTAGLGEVMHVLHERSPLFSRLTRGPLIPDTGPSGAAAS
jgi:hypothetical protein